MMIKWFHHTSIYTLPNEFDLANYVGIIVIDGKELCKTNKARSSNKVYRSMAKEQHKQQQAKEQQNMQQ